MRTCSKVTGCAAFTLLLLAAPVCFAAGARASMQQPASLFAQAGVEACENNPGPYITLDGELSLGGVSARMIFRNNRKGTHQHDEDVTADLVLIPAGESIRFNKQPSRGGVGGNPWIYLQFDDGAGNPISDEFLLGRCVQGLVPTGFDFLLDTDVELEITSGSCSGKGGPNINVTGELTLGGLDATITFSNNQKGTHEHEEETEVGITILDAGETLTFAKSPHADGAGGNPLVYLQFLDGDGNPYSGELFLGRCNDLDGGRKKRR